MPHKREFKASKFSMADLPYEDVEKYFSGTYVFDETLNKYCYISDRDADQDEEEQFRKMSLSRLGTLLDDSLGVDDTGIFQIFLPEEGFYKWGEDLMLVTRKEYSNTKKGMCDLTLTINPLSNWRVNSWRWNIGETLRLFSAENCSESSFIPVDVAVNSVQSQEVFGVPLTRKIAVAQGMMSRPAWPGIWIGNTQVGCVVGETCFTFHGDLFTLELSELFKKVVPFDSHLWKEEYVSKTP